MKQYLLSLFSVLASVISPLAAEQKILAFAGSTRADSYNKKLVQRAADIARQMGATVTIVDLADYPMPFYDADLEKEQGMPANAKRFRDLMISHDSIIIASPEYNASLSGVLKNTIDWASRSPSGGGSKEAFAGKKFAIMSASPGKGGGARGLVHLRNILEGLGGIVVQPQVSIPNAGQGMLDSPLLKEEIDHLLSKATAPDANQPTS